MGLATLREGGKRHGAALLLLLPAVLVLHARELAGGRPFFRDLHQLLLPVRHFAAEALRRGEFPAWWPYDGAGSPLAAQPLFELFHPVQLLSLVLPFWRALALENLLASLAIAAGTYLLAVSLGSSRRGALLAAGLFVTSGVVVSMQEFAFQRLATAAMPWYGWSLLRAARARARIPVLPAFVLASALVVEPQFAAFAALFGSVLVLSEAEDRRAGWRVVLLAPLGGALLAAVQLLPAAFLAPYTGRAGTLAEAERWVVGGRVLAAMVLPHDLGRDELYVSVFVGPALVFLLGASVVSWFGAAAGSAAPTPTLPQGGRAQGERSGRRDVGAEARSAEALPLRGRVGWGRVSLGARGLDPVRTLWLLALVSLWAGAGSPLGLGRLLRMLPVWSSFRYPEKWLVPALLAFCLLAAEGFDGLRRREPKRLIAGIAVLLAATLAALFAGPLPSAGTLALLGSITLATLALPFVSGRPGLLLAAALAGTPLLWTLGALRYTDDAFYAPGPMVELLRKEGVGLEGPAFERSNLLQTDPERWAAMRAAGAGGGGTAFNGFFGLPTLAPALPGTSRRLGLLYAHPEEMSSRLDGVFGVGVMVLSPEQIIPRLESQVLGRENTFGWTAIRLKRSLPRAYATSRARPATSPEEAVSLVLSPEFRPGREVIVEGSWDEAWARPEQLAVPVEITGRTNASVHLSAELPWDGLVVLNEAWFPGWKAEVDGKPAPLLVANAAMRAVPVPAGRHEVVFSYRTPGLLPGLVLTLLSAIGLLALAARARRLRPSSSAPG